MSDMAGIMSVTELSRAVRAASQASGKAIGRTPLLTTVVGSYPEAPTPHELAMAREEGADPFAGSLARSIDAQLESGIDVVSDGQTRSDMVTAFASRLAGVRMKGKPEVIGEIRHRSLITVADLAASRRRIGHRGLLKGILTGPYTLAKSSVDMHYRDFDEMAMAYAKALNAEARAIGPAVDVLQVDEPFLSVEWCERAGELTSAVLEGVECPCAIHVCGDVAQVFPRLAELDVDILDHEFARNPGLLDSVAKTDFPQLLGYGCLRSDDAAVEPASVVAQRIKAALRHFPPEKLMPDPDCGLGQLPLPAARSKLESLVAARDIVLEDLA